MVWVETGREYELLSYFWPDKEWYIGDIKNRKVHSRTHDEIKKQIDLGKLKIKEK